MADGTHIEWTDATWQPITGCSVVSPGCTNCYAMGLAGTRLRNHPSREGLTIDTKAGPVWNGKVRFNEQWLDQPLHWRRPRRIFVCAHGDLFHKAVPDEWIDRVFAVMALSPQHTFQVPTKRSGRMREYLRRLDVAGRWAIAGNRMGFPLPDPTIAVGWQRNGLPNVWLGVSVEDQQRADERIPDLLATPAAKRFLSCEPLLGPIDLNFLAPLDGDKPRLLRPQRLNALTGARGEHGTYYRPVGAAHMDWVIAGGESGPNARPMHPDWARSLRDQCQAAGVAFFFKQWGEWAPFASGLGSRFYMKPGTETLWLGPTGKVTGENDADDAHSVSAFLARVGKKAAGRLLDGREWSEFPNA